MSSDKTELATSMDRMATSDIKVDIAIAQRRA